MHLFLRVGFHLGIFACLSPIFLSSAYSKSNNSREQGLTFAGKVSLSDGEVLEFIWVEKLGLWVGKYEVTLGQLVQLLNDAKKRPNHYAARYVEGDYDLNKFPAVMVSWDDAKNACNILNRRYGNKLPDGCSFRLPTENEWEAMAKCDDDRIYPWGDSWPPSKMRDGIFPNLQGEEVRKIDGKVPAAIRIIEGYRDGWLSMAPVAESGANEWGIYGLAGNVAEWVEGWYDEKKKLRPLKGGSAFSHQPFQCKISAREAVEGQSTARGLFFWGTVKNQGKVGTGFRVVVGP